MSQLSPAFLGEAGQLGIDKRGGRFAGSERVSGVATAPAPEAALVARRAEP